MVGEGGGRRGGEGMEALRLIRHLFSIPLLVVMGRKSSSRRRRRRRVEWQGLVLADERGLEG